MLVGQLVLLQRPVQLWGPACGRDLRVQGERVNACGDVDAQFNVSEAAIARQQLVEKRRIQPYQALERVLDRAQPQAARDLQTQRIPSPIGRTQSLTSSASRPA